MGLERSGGLFIAMGGEVVQDHHCAGRDLWYQDLTDICSECGTVHRALNHPRCNQALVGQTGDQSLCAPTPKWRIRLKAFAARSPAAQPGEVCLDRRFVQKNNALRHPGYGGLAMRTPILALSSYLGAAALGGFQ